MARTLILALAAVTLQVLFATAQARVSLWPLPRDMDISNGVQRADNTFFLSLTNRAADESNAFSKAVQHYSQILKDQLPAPDDSNKVARVTNAVLTVTDPDSPVDMAHLDSSYTLQQVADETTIHIKANTTMGAVYALETLSQLLGNGTLNFTTIHIQDYASFEHRGLVFDAASRYAPPSMVRQLIELLPSARINFLYLRFLDDAAVRLKLAASSDIFGNNNGVYDGFDMPGLVAYAAQFGVILVPEMNLPFHASALVGDDDVTFCTDEDRIIGNTTSPAALEMLAEVVADVGSTFNTSLISIVGRGADDQEVSRLAHDGDGCPRRLRHKGQPYGQFTQLEHFSIGVAATFSARAFCDVADCYPKDSSASNSSLPTYPISWLNDRQQDDVYTQSVLNYLFPTLHGFGGMLWNANTNLPVAEIDSLLASLSTHLEARGLPTCSCMTCNLSTSCNGTYTKVTVDAPVWHFGFIFGLALVCVIAVAVAGVEINYLSTPKYKSGYAEFN
ncbi:uncharacterized protein MONBRDRAFT_38414 [Monosiga brevicollis MX1]|uniref:beta-N-acetylhexosaminidase n=1 Tax=Monosiga brevicollis TaxID=81824 RepID=A9V7L0_MONBE|nr:uncharacterized protein MONBRDRAFT_38414 [Monosiga brevicollis MX1]EDQ86534.1 predicted protein [Monosiga brevicollis MX1]|eukprot:XP_001748647.1 hypothetical protein [Monosiga brevicollis MX1]